MRNGNASVSKFPSTLAINPPLLSINYVPLSSIKNIKNLKIWTLSIFKNSKNQIWNNCIIGEKKG